MRAFIVGALFLLGAKAADVPTEQKPAVDFSPKLLCGGDDTAPGSARILPGYGGGGFSVSTSRPRAQLFFNNGMQLGHAFAHKASIAAFHEASRLDPLCAMCKWGEAWASGPTINYDVKPVEVARLAKMADDAERLAAAGPLRERQLTQALQLRYRHGGGKGKGDIAFAQAMERLAIAYPDDDAIVTVTADAWMILASLGDDRARLPRAVALLETVLARSPDYTPAIHFYIHATEMSGFPNRATPYANKLAALAPAASHLVHMPSHTYFWTGRYQEAVDANVGAVALGFANAKQLKLPLPDGVWQLPYHPHNVQFGVGAALISGDGKNALALGEPVIGAAANYPGHIAYAQMAGGTGYFAMARYADPTKVLALPDPGKDNPFMQAYRHYARGEAYAQLGDAAKVRAEAALIPDSVGPARKQDQTLQATATMRIAKLVLIGRAAILERQPMVAAAAYRRAATIEESSVLAGFSDPPGWWYPVRRSLALALLKGGKPAEAHKEIDATLARWPYDPVSTMIRARIGQALGRKEAVEQDRSFATLHWHGDAAMLSSDLS